MRLSAATGTARSNATNEVCEVMFSTLRLTTTPVFLARIGLAPKRCSNCKTTARSKQGYRLAGRLASRFSETRKNLHFAAAR